MTGDWSVVYLAHEKRKVVQSEKDGKREARIDYEGAVLSYDTSMGQPQPALKPPAGRGVLMTFVSPDGRKVVAVERLSHRAGERSKDVTVLWDTATRTAKRLGDGFPMAVFAPDSRSFVLCLNQSNPASGVLKVLASDGTVRTELVTGMFLGDRRENLFELGELRLRCYGNAPTAGECWLELPRESLWVFPAMTAA